MVRGRRVARSLLGASLAALAVVATPAEAQRIDNIVAFGDSYADDDNIIQILLASPLVDQATKDQLKLVYPTGRFSGGTNYVDTLAQILNVPVENFALGGANTDNTNVNGPGLPGFVTEWNAFLAGGGVAPFPAVSGTLDEGDLVTLSIGGNDARAYQKAGGTLAGAPAAAQTSAAFATAGIDALVDAGAQNISFLAGNTAILPEIAGDPNAQAVRDSFSTTFNTTMQGVLAGYAADGVTVHYLDLTLVGQRIMEDPTAYGLTSAGACSPAPQCIGDSAYANQFLFYVDNLHLTSAGFAIVGQYIATQLEAALVLQAPSDMAIDTARQFGRTLSFRTDLGGRAAMPGLHAYLIGDAFSHDVGFTQTNDPFDVDGVGVTAGVEMGLAAGVAGVAANYSRPRVRFGNDAFKENGRSYQIGAYAGSAFGPLFAQAHIGYGKDKHRLSRTGVIDNMTARPDGSHVLAGAKVGYLMPLGPLSVGPVVALDYAKAKIDGYTEQGDAALTLNVSNISYKALTGNAGIELRGGVGLPGASIHPYASAMLEKDLIGDGRTIFTAQTSAPLIVNRFDYPDRSTKVYGRLSGGLSASVLGSLDVQAGASATVGRKQGNEVSANLGVRFGF
jgi:outer membrane autotransporter protein